MLSPFPIALNGIFGGTALFIHAARVEGERNADCLFPPPSFDLMGVAGLNLCSRWLSSTDRGEEERTDREGSRQIWLVMNETHLTHKWETCLRVIV